MNKIQSSGHGVRNVVAGAIVTALLVACQTPQPPTPAAPTPSPVPETSPFITLVPDRATLGAPITVIGSDWLTGEEVTLGLVPTLPNTNTGTLVLAVIIADGQGRFQLTAALPATATAGVWQVYAQTRTPGRFAAATLTILEPTAMPPTATTVPPTQPPSATRRPRPTAERPPPTLVPPPTLAPVPTPVLPVFPDWRGDYFANAGLAGLPALVRNDPVIDFNWGYGSPDPRIPPDNFSARWVRSLSFNPGTYRFAFRADDGVRLYIDNVLVLDDWRDGSPRDVFTDVTLAGRAYSFRIEYYERFGVAQIRFNVFRLPEGTPSPFPTNTPSPVPPPTFTPPPPPPTFTPIPLPTAIPPLPTTTVTPVPTAIPPQPTSTLTPIPLSTATHTAIPLPPTATNTAIPLATATHTAVPATATFTAIPAATSTHTPVPPTATNTAVPVATATPTNTPVPATATHTATPTTVPLNTSTPTATSTPLPSTATSTATPTNTPVPATATNTTTPTSTPIPPTATHTNTPEPPTATPTNTPIPATATETNTPVPPTAEPPTATATDTPAPPTSTATETNTPVPPTATATETPEAPTPTATPAETSTPTVTPVPATATATATVPATQTVSATLTANRLRVQGAGWASGEVVTISLSANADGSEPAELGTARVGRNGRFTLNVTLAQAPPTPAYVIVTNGTDEVIVPVRVAR